MLLRREPDRRVAIPQPSHSALAGQLAAAWGNADVAPPEPAGEIALAASLHDIGWAAWEAEPTRDPETGWPRQFMQVSPLVHVDLWRAGVARARLFGRYVALLVSKHADTIYTRHFDAAAAGEPEREAVRRFLDEQHDIQRALVDSLQADPVTRDSARDDRIEHNRLLVAALDAMSLMLCWGVAEDATVAEVPVAPGRTATLSLRQAGGAVSVDPWPFAARRLRVRVDGKALTAPFPSDAALRRGLAEAPAVGIAVDLVPA